VIRKVIIFVSNNTFIKAVKGNFMKKALLILVIFSFCISCKKDNPTVPLDTVCSDPISIGSQVWMCKNLDVDHYRNGDPIPEVKDSTEWANLTTGAWCYYNNDPALGAIYGKLYNWYAVNDPRGLAPTGLHVPSDAEWTTLSTFLGGENVAGGKLKETGTTHWKSPNKGATNESGFFALPGGLRDGSGAFNYVGNYAQWWSSTQTDTTAWYRHLGWGNAMVFSSHDFKEVGFSVRCIKDN
jgi:uncharacterized protein (TIGR02145 family)